MRVAFAGTPEFALPALAALRTHHEIVGVLTRPDRPSGRGRQLTASPVKQAAIEAGLQLAQPVTLKSETARAELARWQPQVLVVVAYGLLVPPEVLSLPPLGCLNIHASLLPRWRGAAPIERALLAGDSDTGITIMQLDAGLDTGPILLQQRVEILPNDTGGSLRARLAALGADALLEALAGVADGTSIPRAQLMEGATYAPRITKAEARIDWARDALWIERQVRAFNPEPIAEARLEGQQLRIYAAKALEGSDRENAGNGAYPGDIVAISAGSMVVKCGRGRIAVTQVQRPGRRPVSVQELSNSLSLLGRRLG